MVTSIAWHLIFAVILVVFPHWIVLLYVIINGGPITTISILTVFVKIILAIILVISIFEAGSQLYRLVTSPPGAVWRLGEQQ